MHNEVDTQLAGDLFDVLLFVGLLDGSGRSHMQALQLKELGGKRFAETLGNVAPATA
jgi:hypothetical protein